MTVHLQLTPIDLCYHIDFNDSQAVHDKDNEETINSFPEDFE
jgi:hypothetical protein